MRRNGSRTRVGGRVRFRCEWIVSELVGGTQRNPSAAGSVLAINGIRQIDIALAQPAADSTNETSPIVVGDRLLDHAGMP